MDAVIDFAEEGSTNLPVFLHLISLSRKSLVSKEGIITPRATSALKSLSPLEFSTKILEFLPMARLA